MTEAELSPEVRLLILAANTAAKLIAKKCNRPLPTESPTVAEPPPPCVYLADDSLPSGEAARLGLSVIRQWRQCSQGYGVQGTDNNGYICGCAPWPDGGCGGCTSYIPRDNS